MICNATSRNRWCREVLGLVGESGSGKSTLGRTVLRLIDPTSGQIRLDGRDITNIKGSELRRLRQRMQIVFQDPYSSLDPRKRVRDIIGDALTIHHLPGLRAQEAPSSSSLKP